MLTSDRNLISSYVHEYCQSHSHGASFKGGLWDYIHERLPHLSRKEAEIQATICLKHAVMKGYLTMEYHRYLLVRDTHWPINYMYYTNDSSHITTSSTSKNLTVETTISSVPSAPSAQHTPVSGNPTGRTIIVQGGLVSGEVMSTIEISK